MSAAGCGPDPQRASWQDDQLAYLIAGVIIDELVKSRQIPFSVIPAEAGILSFQAVLDPGVRRGDDMKDFLRLHNNCRIH
jgi:hypothetical protein